MTYLLNVLPMMHYNSLIMFIVNAWLCEE